MAKMRDNAVWQEVRSHFIRHTGLSLELQSPGGTVPASVLGPQGFCLHMARAGLCPVASGVVKSDARLGGLVSCVDGICHVQRPLSGGCSLISAPFRSGELNIEAIFRTAPEAGVHPDLLLRAAESIPSVDATMVTAESQLALEVVDGLMQGLGSGSVPANGALAGLVEHQGGPAERALDMALAHFGEGQGLARLQVSGLIDEAQRLDPSMWTLARQALSVASYAGPHFIEELGSSRWAQQVCPGCHGALLVTADHQRATGLVIVLDRAPLHPQAELDTLGWIVRLSMLLSQFRSPRYASGWDALDRHLDREVSRSGRNAGVVSLLLLQWMRPEQPGDTSTDTVSANVATALSGEVRKCDTLVSLGEREFALIITDADIQMATKVAERIRRRLAKIDKVKLAGGLAQFDPASSTVPVLIQRASEQLAEATQSGGDQVKVATTPEAQAKPPS